MQLLECVAEAHEVGIELEHPISLLIWARRASGHVPRDE